MSASRGNIHPGFPFEPEHALITHTHTLAFAGDKVYRTVREFVSLEHGEEMQRQATEEGLNQAGELFRELTDKFGISHAGYKAKVGLNEHGQVSGIVESDFIAGEECPNPKEAVIPEHQKGAARTLLGKLTSIVDTKLGTDEKILADIFKYQQYRYVPEADEAVLVDTDPYFEGQFGIYLAVEDMRPLAQQLLEPTDYGMWDARMTAAQAAAAQAEVSLDQDF